jgi:DNA-binding MarR family transcriptional regulator
MTASTHNPPSGPLLPSEQVMHVAGHCLCLKAQRAARALARRFDAAFKPLGLTNGQFSLMMALNRPAPPTIGELAPFLAMDRTSLTAMLKPLERRDLVRIEPDAKDRRARRVAITADGVALLERALPIWRAQHMALDEEITPERGKRLRADLATVVAEADRTGPRQNPGRTDAGARGGILESP